MNPRTILFIHQSFPGQFSALAKSLVEDGHRVFALALNPQEKIQGVTVIRYAPIRRQDSSRWPYLMQEMDAKLIRAESIHAAMKALKKSGLDPDVIYVHPGWGEGLFVKNVWPDAKFAVYAEWYYHLKGQEVNFDPEFPPLSEEQELRLTIKNDPFLHAISECDLAISPTKWQRSRYPDWAWDKIHVIHDGLDLEELARVQPRALGIPSQGLKLRKGMPIVTFSARHLEPVRGFHYFMRALPEVLEAEPEAHVIVMGQDAGMKNIGYGASNPKAESWRKTMEKELGSALDWKRVHFLGMIDRKLYLAMLKLSACHVYLTTPFILSWSFLEAAALGLPIVASKTPPVMEFDDLAGLHLVDFDDVEGIAQKVISILAEKDSGFTRGNLDKLASLDRTRTIPEIKKLLLMGTRATDMGGKVEEIVLEDIEESE